jgi:K+-transporting ATPase ATPase B chain
MVVSRDRKILGVVHLKDTLRPGLRPRLARLRAMGIRTIMVTGDNPLTAATIAAEAGVDDFVAEASPEAKLKLIRDEQAKGRLVAMCGDGTNDAPALAQADVGVALNLGTAAAREAGNMIDLDSDPLKLMTVIRAAKRLLTTRRALTMFSIANDVAKYFVILLALFVTAYPELAKLNVMTLASPASVILSAVIFNAVIIILLIPLALRGLSYVPTTTAAMRRNLLVYGLGGLILPFIGIKAVNLVITGLSLV